MMPMTPSGTRILPTWMPEGRYFMSDISPIGSASAAIWRRPSAMPLMVFSVKVRRSTEASSSPLAFAAATSCAFAASSLLVLSRMAVAMFSSAWFFALVSACATMREAARACCPTPFMYCLMSSITIPSFPLPTTPFGAGYGVLLNAPSFPRRRESS